MSPQIRYVEKDFQPATLRVIGHAVRIIDEFVEAGYRLTLRQLYYQFVARTLLPNTQRAYNRLGRIVRDARRAGLIDWDAIEDRTRNLQSLPTWEDPAEIVEACASSFRFDRWARQPVRVEVWVEKDALAGVFDRVCRALRVPLFAARGYPSDSEVWSAAYERFAHYWLDEKQETHILHFGDHDPSGIDMTRDLLDRLGMFMTGNGNARCRQLHVQRLALNMDQVRAHDLPPNPAKTTDSRYEGYTERYGDESWELDALNPAEMERLVREAVEDLRDEDIWREDAEREAEARRLLTMASDRWSDVVAWLERGGEPAS